MTKKGVEIERAEWNVYSSGNKNSAGTSLASIKIKMKGFVEIYTAEEGVGPVDALGRALFKAVRQTRPEVDEIQLVDFSVTYSNGKKGTASGTAAEVVVSVDFARNGKLFKFVEVSENILEAVFKTLVRGIEAVLEPL